MKIKKGLSRLISGILTVSMLSSPFVTFADHTNATSGADASASGGSGVSGLISAATTGWRLTFVDTLSGTKVGESVDIIASVPNGVSTYFWTSAADDGGIGSSNITITFSGIASQMGSVIGDGTAPQTWYKGYGKADGRRGFEEIDKKEVLFQKCLRG